MKLPFDTLNIVYNPESPHILVLGEQYFALVKESGHVLWMYKLPYKVAELSSAKFSKDGSHFCFVFENGSYILYTTAHGRQVFGFQPKAENVTCTAFNEDSNDFGILGHSEGTVTINVENKVPFEVEMLEQNERCLHVAVNSNSYIAVGEYNIATMKFDFERKNQPSFAGEFNNRNLRLPLTLAGNVPNCVDGHEVVSTTAKLLDLQQQLTKTFGDVVNEYKEFRKSMSRFFNSYQGTDLGNDITLMTLSAHMSERLREWIQKEHEQGFNRWYNNYNLHLSKLRQLVHHLTTNVVLELLDLDLNLKAQENKSSTLLLQKEFYDFHLALNTLSASLDKYAAYFQKLFSDEIDRSITVCNVKEVDVRDIFEEFSNKKATEALGDHDLIYKLKVYYAKSMSELNLEVESNMERIRKYSERKIVPKLMEVTGVWGVSQDSGNTGEFALLYQDSEKEVVRMYNNINEPINCSFSNFEFASGVHAMGLDEPVCFHSDSRSFYWRGHSSEKIGEDFLAKSAKLEGNEIKIAYILKSDLKQLRIASISLE